MDNQQSYAKTTVQLAWNRLDNQSGHVPTFLVISTRAPSKALLNACAMRMLGAWVSAYIQ